MGGISINNKKTPTPKPAQNQKTNNGQNQKLSLGVSAPARLLSQKRVRRKLEPMKMEEAKSQS